MKIRIRKNFISPMDWLLILGLTMAPMTAFRVWKIGPGEVLCLLWCMKYVISGKIKKNIIFDFWVVYFPCMLIGTLIGIVVAPEELRLSDLLSWIVFAILSIEMYQGLSQHLPEYNARLFDVFCHFFVYFHFAVFCYSIFISRELLGVQLWYGESRFASGGSNPHQIAVGLSGVFFCFVRNVIHKKKIVVNMLAAMITLYLLIQTRSSSGLAAVAVGMIVTVFVLTIRWIPNKKQRMAIIMAEILVMVTCMFLGYQFLWNTFYQWVASDKNGIERFNIFSNILKTMVKSPLFGLGPGEHSVLNSSLIEYHNMYLEILAATGLIGFVVFVAFTIAIIKILCKDITSLPIIATLYAYGMGGFSMRRMVFWGIFTFLFIVVKQIEPLEQDT